MPECETKKIFVPFFEGEKTNLYKNVYKVKYNMKTYLYRLVNDRLLVYLNHDKHMGKVYDMETGYVSPNMPKLMYAYNFRIDGLKPRVFKELSPYAKPFEGKNGYYFIKRDGFNLLFYKPPYFNYELTPKTRLLPSPGTSVLTLINDTFQGEFIDSVNELVENENMIPIFEVWGPALKKYDIINGGTNVKKVIEIESIDAPNGIVVELIALRNNDECNYPFVPPKEMLKIAEKYGLKTPPYRIDTVDGLTVYKYYEHISNVNNEIGSHVYEGYVLHVFDDEHGYGMFKVKDHKSLVKDVVLKNNMEVGVIEKVNYEVSKVIMEYDVKELILERYNEGIDQVIEYLKEDFGEDVYKIKHLIIRTYNAHLKDVAIKTYGEKIMDIIKEESKKLKKSGYKFSKYQMDLIKSIFGSFKY